MSPQRSTFIKHQGVIPCLCEIKVTERWETRYLLLLVVKVEVVGVGWCCCSWWHCHGDMTSSRKPLQQQSRQVWLLWRVSRHYSLRHRLYIKWRYMKIYIYTWRYTYIHEDICKYPTAGPEQHVSDFIKVKTEIQLRKELIHVLSK